MYKYLYFFFVKPIFTTLRGGHQVPVPGLRVEHGPDCGICNTGRIGLKFGPRTLCEQPRRRKKLRGHHRISAVRTRRRGASDIWIMAKFTDIERPRPSWGCRTGPGWLEAGGGTCTKSCGSVWPADPPVLGCGTRKWSGSDIWIMAKFMDIERSQPPWGCHAGSGWLEAGGRTCANSFESV